MYMKVVDHGGKTELQTEHSWKVRPLLKKNALHIKV